MKRFVGALVLAGFAAGCNNSKDTGRIADPEAIKREAGAHDADGSGQRAEGRRHRRGSDQARPGAHEGQVASHDPAFRYVRSASRAPGGPAAAGPRPPSTRPSAGAGSAAGRRAAPAGRSAPGPPPAAAAASGPTSSTWSRPPYTLSASTGQPTLARWTRIWCVRPVRGWHADEGEAAEPLDHLVVAAGVLGVLVVLVVGDGHLDAVVRVVGDPALDVVAVAVEDAGRDGRRTP